MEAKTPKKKRKEGAKEHKPSWQETMASVQDIQEFLDGRVFLRYNVVTGRVECHVIDKEPDFEEDENGLMHFVQAKPKSDVPKSYYEPITDRIVNSLWKELSQQKTVRVQDIQRVIDSDYVPDFDPFRFYLSRLPPWNEDKPDYILELAMSISVKGEVKEQIMFWQCLKKWLVGMVAGWINPQVVNNVILVLIGEQGSYKTTWFTYLLPPELRAYFRIKTNSSHMTKDDLLALTQYGLVCYEELDTMSNKELNVLKSAVTMPSVDERPAYGRYHEHRRHLASFCGTGNNVQFLSDATGNRRWLPFEVKEITSPRMFPFNYEGIYSQAYRLYRDGFQFWFSQAETERLAEHNRKFETPRLEVELVQLYFRPPEGAEPGEFMPVSMAMQIVGVGITQKLNSVWLGRAFSELGFQKKTSNNVRGYVVVRRSFDEMRSLRQQMAQSDDTANTEDTVIF